MEHNSCENRRQRRRNIQNFTDANVCSGISEYNLVQYFLPLQTSGVFPPNLIFIEVPMEVSRRIFLRHSAIAAAACAALPMQGWSSVQNQSPRRVHSKSSRTKHAPKSSVSQPDADALQALTRAHFTDAIGTGFKVSLPGHENDAQWLRLMAVNELPKLAPENRGLMAVAPKSTAPLVASTGFSLSFNGTAPDPLPQDTYVFEHDRLGRFALFIVPAGPGKQSYSAVIVRPE
jgi:hypothetical protein